MRTARANMIENQIRAGGIYLQNVFDALDAIRREDFVPPSFRTYAYADMEIPLPCGENMLTPLTEARILQAADIRRNNTVLEIGSGSGYMAALLSHNAQHVITLEIEPLLAETAENNLAHYGIDNVTVVCENGLFPERYVPEQSFDIIVLSGAVFATPLPFIRYLSQNGKILYFFAQGTRCQACLLQKNQANEPDIRLLFDTFARPLKKQPLYSGFRF